MKELISKLSAIKIYGFQKERKKKVCFKQLGTNACSLVIMCSFFIVIVNVVLYIWIDPDSKVSANESKGSSKHHGKKKKLSIINTYSIYEKEDRRKKWKDERENL